MLTEGDLVVDVLAKVRSMSSVHESLENTSDCITLSCSRFARERVPPIRSTLHCIVELVNCVRLEFQAIRVDLELKQKPLDSSAGLSPVRPASAALSAH